MLDEAACLAAMAYVDLNPVRAGIAQTPEESEFTSVHDRIFARQARQKITGSGGEKWSGSESIRPKAGDLNKTQTETDQWLCPIDSETPSSLRGVLSLNTDQYIDLLDWTGRQMREGKRGTIPGHLAPVLVRLEINATRWVHTVQSYGNLFHRMVGKVEAMTTAAKRAGKHWWQGVNACRKSFSPT